MGRLSLDSHMKRIRTWDAFTRVAAATFFLLANLLIISSAVIWLLATILGIEGNGFYILDAILAVPGIIAALYITRMVIDVEGDPVQD